jgi:hypothetical protein
MTLPMEMLPRNLLEFVMRNSSAIDTEYQNLSFCWQGMDSHKKQNDKNPAKSISCKNFSSRSNHINRATIGLSPQIIDVEKRHNVALNLAEYFMEGLAFALVIGTFAFLISISDSLDAFMMGAH